jgi:hypothetical protein
MLDYNDSLGGGATYMAKHGNWKTEGFDMDSWNNHNRDYYNPEQSTLVSTTKVPRSLLHLDRNEFGEPILPDPLLVPRRETGRTWRQALVRAFMTYHYCKSSELKSPYYVDALPALASGEERAIPWKKLVPRLRECVEEEHLPSNLLLLIGEPSTMKDDQCHSLLTFWFRRQTSGMLPSFRFKRYMIKDDLVEALPREEVDIPRTETPPIASSSNILPSAIPPIASGHSPGRNARGTGRHSNKNGKAKRPRGSGKLKKGKGKERATSCNSDKSSTNSISNSDSEPAAKRNARGPQRQSNKKTKSKRTSKSGRGKQGQRKANSNSDESSANSTSNSDSESTTSTSTSENTTDSSTDSDSEDSQSRAPIQNQHTVHQSHADVDPLPMPDDPSGDENTFPSPILNLCPELQSIERMVQQGIPREEVLQSFSALRMRSQSSSPVKAPSRALSPRTEPLKRRGRPSTEGLPPASPTKKSRLENSVERSPGLPTTSLPHLPHPPPIFMEPASLTHQPSFECTQTAPEASSSSTGPSHARGADAQTISRGGGLRGKGSRKKTEVPSQRVTRSNTPKKRTTRARPN